MISSANISITSQLQTFWKYTAFRTKTTTTTSRTVKYFVLTPLLICVLQVYESEFKEFAKCLHRYGSARILYSPSHR